MRGYSWDFTAGVCCLAFQILTLDLISDQYLWDKCKGKLPPGIFVVFTFGDKQQRERFSENVFEASILCFFIVSFKRCYNEYLLWFFFTFCWSLNLLMSFFPSKTWLQNSVCVATVCVMCVHPLYKDISQAIIGTFFQYILQNMVGWVALRFVIAFRWSLNCLKCDSQCLFLSYCNSCSACEMSFLTGKECPGKCAHCRSPCQKNFMFIYSLRQLICFVSFKNQNWEMYCLLTAFHDP